ncbi:murein biosynthesis integral membrane protein MurJ [Tahibacter amnicola]|uniref:Peptidoglycan lipid II flippase n=1 Tax=Tahibacter amnicola TaxID=2976241 RepID=A0ABY6B967_9GAMM|nr:lipid II flippase MurJ [Tahibacter amnicola]UXI66332.1 hypothetical protein N4264_16425 [Tahibacter amnicola]
MTRQAHGHALSLSALNLVSKALAVGKTMLIAGLFGAGATLDAFWVAYSLPLLLPALLTTVITVAFVPRFMTSLEGRSGPQAWQGANTLFTLIFLVSVTAAVLMSVYASSLVAGLAPGLAPQTHARAVDLTRVLMPSIPILTMSSILSAISNARERFILPALEGVLTNIAVMACAVLLASRWGVTALIFGVLAGFLLQAVVLVRGNWTMLRENVRPALALRHPDFVAPAAHLLPLFVGAAGSVATGLVNQYFLSHGGEGAISAMAYASMFAFLPVEVFAQAVITTFYPALGRAFAKGDHAAAAESFAEGVRFVLFLTLPCAVLLGVFSEPLMVLLLERGSFTPDDTALTAQLTSILVLGLVFRAFAFFNYRVLHASLRPWLQVSIGLLGVATHWMLCGVLGGKWGAQGVAVATAASMCQSAILSAFAAAWVLRLRSAAALGRELVRLAALTLAMLVTSLAVARWLWPPAGGSRWLPATVAIATAAAVGLATLALARGLRQPDVTWLFRMVRSRLLR